ncbi:MAG: signal peptidase I [Arenicella sp.]|jgi:signal peptidase I
MKPTIVEGDRIVINKLAYDFHFPFSSISLAKLADPKRGDIIVFNSKVSDKRLVKRVIGVPGDIVSMHNNKLSINGEVLQYNNQTDNIKPKIATGYRQRTEDLLGVTYSIIVSNRSTAASSFSPVTVPKDSYLALGDNRDNSADSRYIGFIPRSEIIGRSNSVAMSFDYDDYYLLRKDRIFKSL